MQQIYFSAETGAEATMKYSHPLNHFHSSLGLTPLSLLCVKHDNTYFTMCVHYKTISLMSYYTYCTFVFKYDFFLKHKTNLQTGWENVFSWIFGALSRTRFFMVSIFVMYFMWKLCDFPSMYGAYITCGVFPECLTLLKPTLNIRVVFQWQLEREQESKRTHPFTSVSSPLLTISVYLAHSC